MRVDTTTPSVEQNAIDHAKRNIRSLKLLQLVALALTLVAIALLFATRGLRMADISQRQAVVIAAVASIGVAAAVVAALLAYKYVLALQVIEFRLTTSVSHYPVEPRIASDIANSRIAIKSDSHPVTD